MESYDAEFADAGGYRPRVPTAADLRSRVAAADILTLNYVLGWLSADPEPYVRAAVAEALDAADARNARGYL